MKKINHIDSIRHPIITEKATILSEQNKTVFKVCAKANDTTAPNIPHKGTKKVSKAKTNTALTPLIAETNTPFEWI